MDALKPPHLFYTAEEKVVGSLKKQEFLLEVDLSLTLQLNLTLLEKLELKKLSKLSFDNISALAVCFIVSFALRRGLQQTEVVRGRCLFCSDKVSNNCW